MSMAGTERIQRCSWLSRDVLLISLSAFFADMGYQAVTAIFPLIVVLELHEPAYIYGVLLGLSFGVGSVFSLVGGKLGDRYGKKRISLLGNLLIPLMSLSVLFHSIILLGALFIFGWWARYFRTPVRRAWMVEVSNPEYRSKIFGFLHALDVGGGIIAVMYSIFLVFMRFSLQDIVLITSIPLLISSLALALAKTNPHEGYLRNQAKEEQEKNHLQLEQTRITSDFVFKALLLSATLFGFSYYALGFPIVTVAMTEGSDIYGILTFGIYLGVSAFAGFTLGSLRGKKPLRTLWSIGYLLAAVSSLSIGLSYLFNGGLWLFYLGAAGLGFATGSVETFEPVLIAALSRSRILSTRMGWLSSSRAVGLFVSNIVMGLLFVLGEFDSYLYAAITASIAALVLFIAESRSRRNHQMTITDH